MFVVVNHLPVRPDADLETMRRVIDAECEARLKAYPEIKAMIVSRPNDEEVTLVILFESRAFGEEFSSKVAGPWFAEHIRPFLAGPARRSAGDMMAGFAR